MSLSNILADVASIATIDISNTSDRAYIISRINDAADELYMSKDLVGSLREQLFAWDLTQNQVTLPSYVHSMRGMRFWRANINATVQDMRPRFSNLSRYTNSLQWRYKGVVAIERDIDNASAITVVLPDKTTEAFTVTIVGTTPTAMQHSEIISFAIGDQQKTSLSSFIAIKSILKSSATIYDLAILDVEGKKLAFIPNNETYSRYTQYQLKEGYNPGLNVTTYTQFLEILYKVKFVPFVEDSDEFPCPNYDKAIIWKFLEHYYLQTKKPDDASYARVKCDEILKNVAADSEEFIDMRLQFAPNGLYGMFNTFRGRMGYYQIPGDFRLQ